MRSFDRQIDCNLVMVSLEWNVQGSFGRNELISKPFEKSLNKFLYRGYPFESEKGCRGGISYVQDHFKVLISTRKKQFFRNLLLASHEKIFAHNEIQKVLTEILITKSIKLIRFILIKENTQNKHMRFFFFYNKIKTGGPTVNIQWYLTYLYFIINIMPKCQSLIKLIKN